MMTRTLERIVSVGAVFVFLTAPVSATPYWVDGLHGMDVWTGQCEVLNPNECDPPGDLTSPACCGPKKHIQAGLDLANTPGDVVTILPGEYSAGFNIGTSQAGVTLRGLGEVVIQATTASVVSGVSGPLTRIENITFRGPAANGQLYLADSSHVLLDRCRFIEGVWGLNTHDLSQDVTVRECLFIRNRWGIVEGGGAGMQLQVERCTFARNEVAYVDLSWPSYTLLLNCAFFDNALPPSTTPVYSYCNFSTRGDEYPVENCPDYTNTCDAPPEFIDPDNDIYYVKVSSPLLIGGQNGGPVGAFRQGFHTSKDVTKDQGCANPPCSDPPQGSEAWAAWRWVDADDNLRSLTDTGLDNPVAVNGDGEVILVADGEARIYSPVFDTGNEFAVIRSVDFAAFEDTAPDAGSREVIDAVKSTPRREVRIRTHTHAEGPFSQDPGDPPLFEDRHKHVKFRKHARYVQMELVLRNDGD